MIGFKIVSTGILLIVLSMVAMMVTLDDDPPLAVKVLVLSTLAIGVVSSITGFLLAIWM